MSSRQVPATGAPSRLLSASRVAAGPTESIALPSGVVGVSPPVGSCRVSDISRIEPLCPAASLISIALLTLPCRSRMWTTTTLREPTAAAADWELPSAPV